MQSCLKFHGGKGAHQGRLAKWIIKHFPDHLHFVETHFGGGAITFAKPFIGVSEIANDINGRLTNFWNVLKRDSSFAQFKRIVDATPFSKVEWELSRDVSPDPIEDAVRFFVFCRQSLAGRMGDFASISRTRLRRKMNEQVSAWWSSVDGLYECHARLRRIVIFNEDAFLTIAREDTPKTLFYCDPPYPKDTRTAPEVYEYEMTTSQHLALLQHLASIRGKFVISTYPNDLYHTEAIKNGWNHDDFIAPNNASGSEQKRIMTERIYYNF